jgi:hypothetical protein
VVKKENKMIQNLIIAILITALIMWLIKLTYDNRMPKCSKGGRCDDGTKRTSKWQYSEMWGGMTGGHEYFYCSKCGKDVTEYNKL